jgi:hypothetical protein
MSIRKCARAPEGQQGSGDGMVKEKAAHSPLKT